MIGKKFSNGWKTPAPPGPSLVRFEDGSTVPLRAVHDVDGPLLQAEHPVLDEPLAGLDPTGKQDLLRVIDAYHSKTRATIIMISHNMDDIVSVAGRVIVMHEGRKVLDGSPEDVFSDPDRILALGLGLPTVSRIVREMNARGDHIPASVCRKEDLVRFLTEGRA